VRARSNAYVLDIDRIAASMGRRYWQDDSVLSTAHDALYSPRLTGYREARDGTEFGASVQAQLLQMFRATRQVDAVKLVIVALDHTLWHGEAGATAADIGRDVVDGWPMGLAEALLFLKARGIALAVISKNDESRVREAWPRMYGHKLSLDDFAIVRINGLPKPQNMREILASVHALARDVVFVDADPAQRSAMKQAFPEMRILGEQPQDLRRILLWSSETQA
jgi:predicted enzyme involved in methoxymalonyl-ACP biosynthesis